MADLELTRELWEEGREGYWQHWLFEYMQVVRITSMIRANVENLSVYHVSSFSRRKALDSYHYWQKKVTGPGIIVLRKGRLETVFLFLLECSGIPLPSSHLLATSVSSSFKLPHVAKCLTSTQLTHTAEVWLIPQDLCTAWEEHREW